MMCGCDAGFTCTRCAGVTQDDDWHREHAPERPEHPWELAPAHDEEDERDAA